MIKEYEELVNNPIIECVSEVRFDTNMPDDIAYAVIYQKMKTSNIFSDFTSVTQPILQLPLEIRKTDSNLKFVPCYFLVNDNISVGISSHSLLFSVKAPYTSYKKIKEFIVTTLDLFKDAEILNVTRVSLRYINKLQSSLFDSAEIKLVIPAFTFNQNNVVNLRLESELKEGIKTILQLRNNNDIIIKNIPERASIIDIDSLYLFETQIKSLNDEQLFDALDKLHNTTHDIFFNLLKNDCKDKLTNLN